MTDHGVTWARALGDLIDEFHSLPTALQLRLISRLHQVGLRETAGRLHAAMHEAPAEVSVEETEREAVTSGQDLQVGKHAGDEDVAEGKE